MSLLRANLQLWAARYPQGEAGPLGAQQLPRFAASKVTLSSPLTIQAQQMKTMDAKLEGDASFFWQCVARHQSGGVISGISPSAESCRC